MYEAGNMCLGILENANKVRFRKREWLMGNVGREEKRSFFRVMAFLEGWGRADGGQVVFPGDIDYEGMQERKQPRIDL